MAHLSVLTRQEASRTKRTFEKPRLNQLCDGMSNGMKRGVHSTTQGTGEDTTGARMREPPRQPPKLPQGRTEFLQYYSGSSKPKKEKRNCDDNLAGMNPQEAMKTMAGARSSLNPETREEIQEGIAYLEYLKANLEKREKEFTKSQSGKKSNKLENQTLVTDDYWSETEEESLMNFRKKVLAQTSGKQLKTPPVTATAAGRNRANVLADQRWTNETHFNFPFVNHDRIQNINSALFPNTNQYSRNNENNLVGQNISLNPSVNGLFDQGFNRIDVIETLEEQRETASDTQLSDTTIDNDCHETYQTENETCRNPSETECDIDKIDLDTNAPTKQRPKVDLNTSSEDEYDNMMSVINRPTKMEIELSKNNQIENHYTENSNQEIIGYKKGLPIKKVLAQQQSVVTEPPPLNVKMPQPKPRVQNPVGQVDKVEKQAPVDAEVAQVYKHTVSGETPVVQTIQNKKVKLGSNTKKPAGNTHIVQAEVHHDQHYSNTDPEQLMLTDYLEQKRILEGIQSQKATKQNKQGLSVYPPNIVVEESQKAKVFSPNIVVEKQLEAQYSPPNIVVEGRPTSTPIPECEDLEDEVFKETLEDDELVPAEVMEMYYNIRRFNPTVADQMLTAGALHTKYTTHEVPSEVKESEGNPHHNYDKQIASGEEPNFGSISPIPMMEKQKQKQAKLNGTFVDGDTAELVIQNPANIEIIDPSFDENIDEIRLVEQVDDKGHKSAFKPVQPSVGPVGSVDKRNPVGKRLEKEQELINDSTAQNDGKVENKHHRVQNIHMNVAEKVDVLKEFQRSPPSDLRERVLPAEQNFGPRYRVPTKPESDSTDSEKENNTAVKGNHGSGIFPLQAEPESMSIMQRMLYRVLKDMEALTERINEMERKGETVDHNNLEHIHKSVAKERSEALVKSMHSMQLNVAAVDNTEQIEDHNFCKLGEAEIQRMRSQCDHTNFDKFTAIEQQYWTILSELSNIQVTVALAKQAKLTGPGAMRIKQARTDQLPLIKHLKYLETKLEEDMRRISNERAGVFPTYKLPDRFGHVDILISSEISRIVPHFNPRKDGSKIEMTLNMLNSLVKTEHISEECYKNLLIQACKGKAHEFAIQFADQPLKDIVTLLIHRYHPQRTIQDYEKDLENFTREKGETLLMAITKLKALIYKIHHGKTPNELAVLTLPILKEKLKQFVDKQVWENAIAAERKYSGTDAPFSFEVELQEQERATGRAWVPTAAQEKSLHAMVHERPSRNPSRQGSPFSRQSSRSPGSPARVWSGGGRVQKRMNPNQNQFRNAQPPPPQQKPQQNQSSNNPPPPPPPNKQYDDRSRPRNRDPPQPQYQQQQSVNQSQQQQIPLPGNQGFVQNPQFRQQTQLPPPYRYPQQRSQSQGFNQRRQSNPNFRGRNQSVEPRFRNQNPQRYNQGPGQSFNRGNTNVRTIYVPANEYRTDEQNQFLRDFTNRSADQGRQNNQDVQFNYPNQRFSQGAYGNSYRSGYGKGRGKGQRRNNTRTIDQSFLINENETVRQRIEVDLGDICDLWECRRAQNYVTHYIKDCPNRKNNRNF